MIYLDNAATTFPKPEIVYKTMDRCFRFECANPGRSGHQLALKAGRNIYDARERVANLFSIDNPMDLIFTPNTTYALNIAIKGILFSGDHVILSSMEHNSVIRPIMAMEEKGVEHTIIRCNAEGEIDIDDIKKAIRPNTKLIVTTHASNVTGTILPVGAIGALAREKNIRYLVDAAQTAGAHDIDVKKMNIDLLAFAGHKSLLGPPGTGGLYVKKGLELQTLFEGGTGSLSESIYQPEMMPDRYESGTANMPAIAGLGASVEWIMDETIEKIRVKETQLTQLLLGELMKIPKIKIYGTLDAEHKAPVISFNIGEKGSSDIAFELDRKYGIACRSGLHCAPLAHETIGTLKQGTVRLSIGYFNAIDEIEKVVQAIKEISKY